MRLVAWLGAALLGVAPIAVMAAGPAPAEGTVAAPESTEPRSEEEGESDGDDEASAGDDEAPAEAAPEPAASATGPTAIDAVLACGLRLVAAEDDTLPVAAVVLAVETGTEDDPGDRPGLVHALAYQLLQGNRDLPPGGITEMVDDGGGVTSLAIGPAQIRYESLVPTSLLDDILWAETHRLRAPTVTPRLWAETLSWARRDAPRPATLPPDVLAAVHEVTGLRHPGRHTARPLQAMTDREVSAALADRFGYDRSTLVVVAPQPPEATLAAVQGLLADLPPRPRRVPTRATVPSPSGDEPRTLPRPDADGRTFAWPIDPDPAAVTWARIWCRTLNGQRRGASEPPKSRIRCRLDRDPRRATLLVRVLGPEDPVTLLRERLQRIADGHDDRLLERARRASVDNLRYDLRLPLALARRLAGATRRDPSDGTARRPVDVLTGIASFEPGSPPPSPLEHALALGRALRLVPSPANR